MKFLETPEERFSGLKDYPFQSNYLHLNSGLRMHYLDEGNPEGDVVLLVHGEPSWSYLYRKMIPLFANQGFRVLAPDLIGFGKSSKPVRPEDYSYSLHVSWIGEWMNSLSLQNVHLFCQDWGGLIMLRILTEHPDAFKSVTISNTGLPTPKYKMPEAFIKWRNFSRKVDELPVSKIIQSSTMRHLEDQELVAYEAPFPDKEYQAGAKVFPSLVPIGEDPEGLENLKVWEKLSRLRTPFLCLFSDSDPITRGGEKPFQKSIPGADHPHHKILKNGGHFIQEDLPDEIVQNMLRFIAEI